ELELQSRDDPSADHERDRAPEEEGAHRGPARPGERSEAAVAVIPTLIVLDLASDQRLPACLQVDGVRRYPIPLQRGPRGPFGQSPRHMPLLLQVAGTCWTLPESATGCQAAAYPTTGAVDDPDHISADDAVRIYRVGKSTLFGWMREGRIKRF